MSSVQRIPLPITTDAAGAGTATTPAPVNGFVLEVRVASGVLTVGGSADFTVTRATDGGTVLAVSNAAAPFSYQPRAAQHTTAGGTTAYAAGIGPVLDPRGVSADDYLTVVVAQGALNRQGRCSCTSRVVAAHERPGTTETEGSKVLVDFNRLSEQEREELAERGKVHGLSAEQLFACDRLSMDPRRYAAYAGGAKMTLSDHEDIRENQRLEAQGRQDAIREQAKETAREAMH